ncbi:MAG: hypothetical protein FD127_3114, partial [Acidimicrobiaceae bacterium]
MMVTLHSSIVDRGDTPVRRRPLARGRLA